VSARPANADQMQNCNPAWASSLAKEIRIAL
jgi:hypothetical protein